MFWGWFYTFTANFLLHDFDVGGYTPLSETCGLQELSEFATKVMFESIWALSLKHQDSKHRSVSVELRYYEGRRHRSPHFRIVVVWKLLARRHIYKNPFKYYGLTLSPPADELQMGAVEAACGKRWLLKFHWNACRHLRRPRRRQRRQRRRRIQYLAKSISMVYPSKSTRTHISGLATW